MKFLQYILLLIICFQLNSGIVFAIDDDYVKRQVLTGIEWNEVEETIDVHYIIAMRSAEISYLYEHTVIFTDDSLSKDEVKDIYHAIIKRDYLVYDIYHSDIIFGNWVELFKDISQEDLSEEQLIKIKDELEEQTLQDFENPPELVNDDWGLIDFLESYLYELVAISIVTYAFWWVRKKI